MWLFVFQFFLKLFVFWFLSFYVKKSLIDLLNFDLTGRGQANCLACLQIIPVHLVSDRVDTVSWCFNGRSFNELLNDSSTPSRISICYSIRNMFIRNLHAEFSKIKKLLELGPSPGFLLKKKREQDWVFCDIKGNVRVYIERMLMSARYYSIAHAYESIYEINLQFVLIF